MSTAAGYFPECNRPASLDITIVLLEMFKKSVLVSTTRPLSGKDIKTLKKSIQLQFPDLEEDELALLFPAKAEVALLKLSNRATAYTTNAGSPLFFDPSGRGELLVPTVYALWLCPHLLPPLFTYSEVSPKVLGGADLFLQGLIVPNGGLGDFASGDLRCVRIPQSTFPFAVGTLEVSSTEVAKTGLKGKGLKLLHCYADQLWALGDKSVPEAGFTPQRIFPQATASEAPVPAATNAEAQAPASRQSADSDIGGTADELPAAVAASGAEQALSPGDQPPSGGGSEVDARGSASDGSNGHAGEAAAGSAPGAGAAAEALPALESQDELLHYCLLAGLRRVPPSELPCLTSDFYSKYMLPAKPAGANVDVKKSSYKKLSNLLKAFEKKGVLSQKMIHKQDNLSAVHTSHELLASFTERSPAPATADPNGSGAAVAAADAHGSDVRTAGSAKAGSSGRGGATSKVVVTAVYRVPVSLRPVFGAAVADKEALHSETEVRAALSGYAQREGLVVGDGRIRLDRLLVGALYNKLEAEKEGAVCTEADVAVRLLGKLTQFHRVVRHTPQGAMEVVQRGSVKPIQVSMQDRQGGRKHITRVIHAESFAIDPDDLGGVLQRKFQTSASVTRLPGKADTGKEIALQGNLLHEIGKVLAAEYGVPLEYVDVKTKN